MSGARSRRECERAAGRLTAAADCEFLLGMRWCNGQLRALLLVVLALLVACQPLARARALVPSTATAMLLEDLQLTICSVHGVMALGPDGLPAPAPEPGKPGLSVVRLEHRSGPTAAVDRRRADRRADAAPSAPCRHGSERALPRATASGPGGLFAACAARRRQRLTRLPFLSSSDLAPARTATLPRPTPTARVQRDCPPHRGIPEPMSTSSRRLRDETDRSGGAGRAGAGRVDTPSPGPRRCATSQMQKGIRARRRAQVRKGIQDLTALLRQHLK